MINLITNLQKNGSTLKKAELLKNFHDPERLKEVLTYTLDPNRNYYIKKLPEFGIGTVSNFNVAWASFRMHLDRLAARDITGNEAIHATVHLLEQMTPELQEVMKRILFRDLRCNVSDKIANKVFPKLIPEFKVQLANKYNPTKKYKNAEWAASRKMDGLRCVLVDGVLYTRNGKAVTGFEHIVDELKTLPDYGKITLVDGELYSHEIPFQKIQGYVLRNKNVVTSTFGYTKE